MAKLFRLAVSLEDISDDLLAVPFDSTLRR